MSKININKTNDIDALRLARQNNISKAQKAEAKPAEKKIETGKDNLQFSSKATEVGKLVAQVKDLPDVRENKVEAFRNQISANTYHPSNNEIADALLADEES